MPGCSSQARSPAGSGLPSSPEAQPGLLLSGHVGPSASHSSCPLSVGQHSHPCFLPTGHRLVLLESSAGWLLSQEDCPSPKPTLAQHPSSAQPLHSS